MSGNGSNAHSTPEETDCLVCGSGKSFTKNQILFCDGPGCDIPVHQNCYGVAVVPEGNWYCQRCEDRISVSNTPSCCCPQKTGAFKRTTTPNQYIHVACTRFHSSLNETFDPINFSSTLANKETCCLCNSNYGLCSQCSVENCTRHMHVTCAQREGLMTKGKDAQLFCDVHRDKVALHRIMKKKERSAAAAAAGRSSSSSGFHRSTKNGASYREISSEDDYDDDDDDEEDEDEDMHGEDDDIEEDEDDYRFESDDQMHQAMLERNLTPRRRNTSAPSTSISPTSATGPRGHTKNTRSLDSTDRDRDRDRDRERRRKDRSPESEEIDVDDTEAVLGSSTLSAQRKKFRTGESGSNKESAAESQRRRLLMNLDKKKRQGSTSSTSLNNLLNMPIRTLGGVGVAAGTGPAGAGAGAGAGTGPGGPAGSHPSSILGGTITNEPKQKLPGISRYNSNAAHSGNNHAMEGPANLYGTNGMSPSVGSAERFPGNGYHQTNGRGVGDGSGRNHKGGFDVESVIDATNFKAYALGSAAPSPIAPNFTNTGVSVAAPTTTTTTAATTTTIAAAATNRSGDKQKRPSRSGPGAMGEDPKELQATIQSLTEKVQQLQQQLANQSGGGGGGSGGSGPQQANDAHEKSRNWTLRQNLREVFGVLQLPVVAGGGGGGGILEYHPERLDEYVQALRDAVVRSHPSPAQDSKRRNMVVDKVLRELADMDVS